MALGSRTRLVLLGAGLGLVMLVGCDRRTMYQVSGHAQYKDGTQINGATRVIRLEPAGDTTARIRKAASGNIAADGTFEMFTRKPGDGVIPGKYVVTFTVMDKPLGGKSLIPPKYMNRDETPFELVVDDDKTGLLFELEKL